MCVNVCEGGARGSWISFWQPKPNLSTNPLKGWSGSHVIHSTHVPCDVYALPTKSRDHQIRQCGGCRCFLHHHHHHHHHPSFAAAAAAAAESTVGFQTAQAGILPPLETGRGHVCVFVPALLIESDRCGIRHTRTNIDVVLAAVVITEHTLNFITRRSLSEQPQDPSLLVGLVFLRSVVVWRD